MNEIEYCIVCDRELEVEKGDAFITDGGEITCNDHYPFRNPAHDPHHPESAVA